MVRIAQILIRVGENAWAAGSKCALLQAQDLSKQLDWVLILTLTKEYSQDEVSNANGEELEWLRESQRISAYTTVSHRYDQLKWWSNH